MLHEKLENALYALLVMAIGTLCFALFLSGAADFKYAARDWSTLDAISDSDEPVQHPNPPGSVVVNNGRFHYTSSTVPPGPKPPGGTKIFPEGGPDQ